MTNSKALAALFVAATAIVCTSGVEAQKKPPAPAPTPGWVPSPRPPGTTPATPGDTPRRRAGRDPAAQADVVGRDLNVPVLGALGHVGIWRGESVAEMLDEPTALQFNTLANFRSRSTYWGAVYYPTLGSIVPRTVCSDIALCERQIFYSSAAYTIFWITGLWWAAGASYTTTLLVSLPQPGRYAPELIPPTAPPGTPAPYVRPTRGSFRCDTFVREVYAAAGVNRNIFSSTVLPGTTYEALSERY